MKIAVVGAGAAGFFAAIQVKNNYPQANVFLIEKSDKVLSKVLVSGGGRCNVTHACFEPQELSKQYPRGEKFLRPLFHHFGPSQMMQWLNEQGVSLKTEQDGRVFPQSNQSNTIVECFIHQSDKLGIKLLKKVSVEEVLVKKEGFDLKTTQGILPTFDYLIITVGGNPKESFYHLLEKTGHKINSPKPSLFTFNMPQEAITHLMGLSVSKAQVKLKHEKLEIQGPLLITHWGMSGPAILKLSSKYAEMLALKNYQFSIQVNWAGFRLHEVTCFLQDNKKENSRQKIGKNSVFSIPQRLWLYLLEKAKVSPLKNWAEINHQEIDALSLILTKDEYRVSGKTTFKDEFVTCGGLRLSEVNPKTLASKIHPKMYFAGEVLDVDGYTGGFNFQAAWTTAFIAAKLA